MADRLRWGILSTAEINNQVIPPLQKSKRSEVIAVASREQGEAKEYAREKGIGRAYGSYDELIAADDIDVVYNPLPNTLHTEWTVKALEAGKHVLCEKPMVVNQAELDQIEDAARRSGKVVFEGVKYLHHPQTWRIVQELQQGTWGRLQMIQGWLHFWLDPADTGNIRLKPELAGGCFWDVGVYPSTYAISINGGEAPVEVYAHQVKGESGVDVHMNVQMRFRTGVVAQISSSFRTPWREGIILSCTDAIVDIPVPFRAGEDQQESRFTVRTRENQEGETITIEAKDPFLGEVEQMEACVLDKAMPLVPLGLSRAFIRTTEAVYESARSKKPVTLSE
jgi:D-xylose 1-dehydrogenase (NADP+, D-xylono-1,5-lactone-forming)